MHILNSQNVEEKNKKNQVQLIAKISSCKIYFKKRPFTKNKVPQGVDMQLINEEGSVCSAY